MAHKLRVKVVPYVNKDGSESKTKKRYLVLDRTRGGTKIVGYASSKDAADLVMEKWRVEVLSRHLENHPNDNAFKSKHGVRSKPLSK